jgi:hypothetical protein
VLVGVAGAGGSSEDLWDWLRLNGMLRMVGLAEASKIGWSFSVSDVPRSLSGPLLSHGLLNRTCSIPLKTFLPV